MKTFTRRSLLKAFVAVTALSFGAVAMAATAVQCTLYVATVKNLPKNYPNAYQWASGYLKNNGYTQRSSPAAGYVIVFQPNAGHGVDTKFGHVGVVRSVSNIKDSRGNVTAWSVVVRGANQGGSQFTDSGCSNVSDITFTIKITESPISYWSK